MSHPAGRIKERLQLWRESPVNTSVLIGLRDERDLTALAKEIDL